MEIEKEDRKSALFADGMTAQLTHPRKPTRKTTYTQ